LPLFSLSLNHRLVFLAAFGLCALAALGAEEVRQGRAASRFVAASAGLAALLIFLFLLRAPRLLALGMPRGFLVGRILFQVVPLLLAAVFVAWMLRRGRSGLAVSGALALLLAARGLEASTVHPTYSARAFYPRLALLEAIPRRQPYRLVGVGYELVPGAAAIYELEDVRGYEMTTLAALVETFPLWCVRQPVWFNRVDDPTRAFLSFLNARYVLAPPAWPAPSDWRILAEDAGGRLLENPNALPRAFVPRRVLREMDPARQRERLFAIRDFGAEGVLEAPGEAARNGEATVSIESYTVQRMEMSIVAKDRTLIATSMTAWPGWRLTVDGQERPLLSYNRAFLAFDAPPGIHRAVLRYWPRSFAAGLWITGLSLAAAVAFFAWPRRRASASESGSSAAIGADQHASDPGRRGGPRPLRAGLLRGERRARAVGPG
ncbi:MAG: YfhO family protein, partial [Thermoanaerobaculia bacterium]